MYLRIKAFEKKAFLLILNNKLNLLCQILETIQFIETFMCLRFFEIILMILYHDIHTLLLVGSL